MQLQAALTERGLADYRGPLKKETAVFIRAGGIFGSINHDTYDPQENVAYAVAFRTLLGVSRLLKDDAVRTFAYEKCLAGLDQFKMSDDRNGVATKGLLYMEKSWDTAYLWENAEAALAYFEAAADTRQRDPAKSRQYEIDGLAILRAIAKHHYGPHGFLTEGVDWNNHVGQEHHIGQEEVRRHPLHRAFPEQPAHRRADALLPAEPRPQDGRPRRRGVARHRGQCDSALARRLDGPEVRPEPSPRSAARDGRAVRERSDAANAVRQRRGPFAGQERLTLPPSCPTMGHYGEFAGGHCG